MTEKTRATVGCSTRVLRQDHGPHDWEPQPGMDAVHCPGYWIETPAEPLSAPRSVPQAPGGELAGRDGDSGAEAPSGGAGWTQLEARAFNAVGPAVRDAGQWLPLSARRAVAKAVLAELKPELDRLADYENRITWDTTCGSCARILDSSIRETERADRAVTALAHARSLHRENCPLATGKVGPAAFTCGMCDALDEAKETP